MKKGDYIYRKDGVKILILNISDSTGEVFGRSIEKDGSIKTKKYTKEELSLISS